MNEWKPVVIEKDFGFVKQSIKETMLRELDFIKHWGV